MAIKNIFFLLFSLSILVSCTSTNDCFVADIVEEARTVELQNNKYFLYLRTSGFNDKEFFYELYDQLPKFNQCGISELSPVSDVHVDFSAGNIERLEIDGYQLKVVYSSSSDKNVDLLNVDLEVK